MKRLFSSISFALLTAISGASAAQSADPAAHAAANAATAAAVPLTDGEVRKVDKETKKITIRHGAIQNLEMPPMTMVFQISDPAMLDQVKAGDKIRFSANKAGGAFTVTKIEQAN